MRKKLSVISMLIFLVIINCSGQRTIFVDTYDMKLISGELKVYEFENGTKGKLLDSKRISSSVVELKTGDQTYPVLLELTNAVFTDLSSGEQFSFSPYDKWSTLIINSKQSSSSTNPFQINPLTSIGTALAGYKISYSLSDDDAILKSKDLVASHFKFNPDNSRISSDSNSLGSSNPDGIKYFLAIAGLSQLSKEISKNNVDIPSAGNVTINDITRILVEDVSYNGVFDGISKNGELKIGNYQFSEKTLKEDLVNAIRNFMNEKGIEENEDIFSFFQNILNDSSELFIPANGVDFQSPFIQIISPEERKFIAGTTAFHIEATDPAGVAFLLTYLNDALKTAIKDLEPNAQTFMGELDTKLFNDGPISIIANAQDNNGNTTQRLFTFYIDNSPPSFITNLHNGMVLKDSITLTVTASDGFGSGINGVKIKGGESYLSNIQSIGSGQFIAELNTLTLPEGNNYIEVEVQDNAGNMTKSNYTVFVNNNILSNDAFIGSDGGSPSRNSYTTIYAGDLNADGFPDIVSSHNAWSKNVRIHFGNQNLDYTTYSLIDNYLGQMLSYKVSIAGDCDIDGDNISDLVIGSPNELACFGRTFAFLGPIDNTGDWKDKIIIPNPSSFPSPTDYFGAYAGCEDMDGDGYDDVTASNHGGSTVYVFFGPSLKTHAKIMTPTGKISRVGDINGDGISDEIINRTLIYGSRYRNFTSFTVLPYFDSVSTVGDINNDGYSEILIGEGSYYNNGVLGFGTAQIIYGGPQFPNYTKTISPPYYCANFGEFVTSGDIDGDGTVDLAISSPNNNIGNLVEAGEVFVFFGPDFQKYKVIRSSHPESYDHFGLNLKSGFDLNLDRRSDLIVQEPGQYNSGNKTGSFHVFYDTN